MDKLVPIEHKGKRVLTTAQLAESFEVDSKVISKNYERNELRYKLGKHYFVLEGDELRTFKANRQIDDNLKFAPSLQLWTEKGAWFHAKSLNTDKAWQAYESLVDDYYEKAGPSLPSSIEDLIIMQAQSMKDMKAKVIQLEDKVNESVETVATIKETLLHHDKAWRKSIIDMINAAVARTKGDHREIRSDSYKKLEERASARLNIQLTNLKKRLEDSGATKTKIEEASKLDVIENDKRLKEIYTIIVKEISIGTL